MDVKAPSYPLAHWSFFLASSGASGPDGPPWKSLRGSRPGAHLPLARHHPALGGLGVVADQLGTR